MVNKISNKYIINITAFSFCLRLTYGSIEHNSELLIALFQTLANLNFIRRIYKVLHRIVIILKH